MIINHRSIVKPLVVKGGLTTGLLHALVAMDMPGPGTVFIGDTITAEAEVTSFHERKPLTQMHI